MGLREQKRREVLIFWLRLLRLRNADPGFQPDSGSRQVHLSFSIILTEPRRSALMWLACAAALGPLIRLAVCVLLFSSLKFFQHLVEERRVSCFQRRKERKLSSTANVATMLT